MGKIPGEGKCLAKVPWRVPYLLEGRQAGSVGKIKRFFCCSTGKVPAAMF